MTFHLGSVGERERGLAGFGRVSGDVARLLFPFFHDRRIARDFDLFLIIDEAHAPAEARFVEVAQLWLIVVVIGRAEQSATKPAARHIREITLERFALDNLNCVKIVARAGEGAGFQNCAISCDRAVFAQLKERAILRGGQLHIVALRLFQKKAGQRENRIGDRTGFDLRDHAVESGCVRQETNVDRNGLNHLALPALVIPALVLSRTPATGPVRFWPAWPLLT